MGYSRIQQVPFRLEAILGQLDNPQSGGVAFYIGRVRGREGKNVTETLEYHAYEGMAEAELEKVRLETVAKFSLLDAVFLHRTGRFGPNEAVLLVAISARHRKEAFEALPYALDRIKATVPIWKREEGPGGTAWLVGETNRRMPA